MAYGIARIAKQKGGSVGSSSLHNGRGRDTPNADPEREKDNRIIIGDERPTPERVREIIAEHGGKPRSDSVEAVEILVTASPEWWRDDQDEIDLKKVDRFIAPAREFLSDRQNGGICVKATLHLDEHSPHVHAIMVPIDPNGKLNCKYYFGTKEQLSQWQDRFAEKVEHLGLERGVKGSRARHVDIKDFYKAIERDPKIVVDYEKLPSPPKMCVTKEAAQKFKEEFAKALVEQIKEPIKTELHQAMLTRDTNNKLKETKMRLGKSQEELALQRSLVSDLTHEKGQLQRQAQEWQERGQKAEARVQDVDHGTVMKMLGYKAVANPQRGVIDFAKAEKNLMVRVFPGGVYDVHGQIIARNAVSLVQETLKREGQTISRDAAVGWLADHCGAERATAASLVEREQSTEASLHERKAARSRTITTPDREKLTRAEPERIQDRGHNRAGHDRDSGPSR